MEDFHFIYTGIKPGVNEMNALFNRFNQQIYLLHEFSLLQIDIMRTLSIKLSR